MAPPPSHPVAPPLSYKNKNCLLLFLALLVSPAKALKPIIVGFLYTSVYSQIQKSKERCPKRALQSAQALEPPATPSGRFATTSGNLGWSKRRPGVVRSFRPFQKKDRSRYGCGSKPKVPFL